MKEGSFTGDCEGKVNYYGTYRRKLWRQASPLDPIGEGGEEFVYSEF